MKSNELQKIIRAAELVNSTLDLKTVLNNIISAALELTGSDRGTIYLVDREKNEVRSVIATGMNYFEIILKLGEGLAGYVAKTGETINIKDVDSDNRFNVSFDILTGYKTKNMICFPIKDAKRETVGVLQLLNSSNGEFSERDEVFLETLSIHAAIAINNALMMRNQIELNEQLKEAKQEAEKFAMLRSHFLTQMSHEIRTPLNIILSGLDYLRMKASDSQSDDLQEIFTLLQSGSNRITRTIDSIIEMSKIKTGNYKLNQEELDLEEEILLPTIKMLEPEALKKGIELIYRNNAGRHLVTKDVFMLHQIFLELIDNGIKFTESGCVEITKFINSAGSLTVGIRDTGIGIAADFIPRIFEPFTQEETGLTRKYEGNGLALALVKKYAELNNITIAIKSQKGFGTEFTVTFEKEN